MSCLRSGIPKKLACPLLFFICTLVHLSQSWQGKLYRFVLLLLLFACLFLFFPDLAFEWLRETWGGCLFQCRKLCRFMTCHIILALFYKRKFQKTDQKARFQESKHENERLKLGRGGGPLSTQFHLFQFCISAF